MPKRDIFPHDVKEMLDCAYWRVIVRPVKHVPHRIPYAELRSTLDRIQVRLRGWYFPHLSNKPPEIVRGTDYYGTWCNFSNYEYWRFYESAQLIHYHGVREKVDTSYSETIDKLTRVNLNWLSPDWSSVKGHIDIINFLYTVTEIFEFAKRLAAVLSLEEAMHVEIALRNISGFILGVSDHSRAWDQFHQWNGGDLANAWDIEAPDLIANSGDESIVAVTWFFQRFGWTDVNLKALSDAQTGFLKKQL